MTLCRDCNTQVIYIYILCANRHLLKLYKLSAFNNENNTYVFNNKVLLYIGLYMRLKITVSFKCLSIVFIFTECMVLYGIFCWKISSFPIGFWLFWVIQWLWTLIINSLTNKWKLYICIYTVYKSLYILNRYEVNFSRGKSVKPYVFHRIVKSNNKHLYSLNIYSVFLS